MDSEVCGRCPVRLAERLALALLAALSAGLLSARANAASVTATFTVTATITPACTIQASELNFGSYADAQVDGQSTITVTCTNTTGWEVALNEGSSAGATIGNRRMTGPGPSSLNYGLFTDAARTINWGDRPALPGQNTVSGTGTGAGQALTVFGRIPAGQRTPRPGTFLDTITATITF
jgi:spore coat protein U-like protein